MLKQEHNTQLLIFKFQKWPTAPWRRPNIERLAVKAFCLEVGIVEATTRPDFQTLPRTESNWKILNAPLLQAQIEHFSSVDPTK